MKLSIGLPGGQCCSAKILQGEQPGCSGTTKDPCGWTERKGDEVRGHERTKKPLEMPSFLYNQGRSHGGLYLR